MFCELTKCCEIILAQKIVLKLSYDRLWIRPLFTCKRGRGLRRQEPDDHAHYDQKDLCVLFCRTGSISSDKSRCLSTAV